MFGLGSLADIMATVNVQSAGGGEKKAILAIYFSSKPGLLHRSIWADNIVEGREVVAAG